MCSDIFEQRNVFLDQILAERRSHRVFRPEAPSEDGIRRILHAGLLAPFAAAAVGDSKDYFRRFFVMRNGSRSMKAVIPLVREQVAAMAQDIERKMEDDPVLRAKAVTFVQRLAAIRKMGQYPVSGLPHGISLWQNGKGFPRLTPVACALHGEHVAESDCPRARVPARLGNLADVPGPGILPGPGHSCRRMGADGMCDRLSCR